MKRLGFCGVILAGAAAVAAGFILPAASNAGPRPGAAKDAARAQPAVPTAAPVAPPLKLDAPAPARPSVRTPLRVDAAIERSFSFEDVAARARALAAAPYASGKVSAPAAAAALNYDQYRRIEFRREEADWWGDPTSGFHAHYETRGFLFNHPVTVNIVEDGVSRPRPYDPAEFNFFDLPLSDEDKRALGFAGFHLTAPLNSAGKFDDVINFKGASFFRALGAGNFYGASARGLALSTASPTGEEFPVFREFWIERPKPGAGNVVIHALLDSQSVAGAYRFNVAPGPLTTIDVEARIYPRRAVNEAGVAPLTSMFDFAPQDPAPQRQDFRPRVHDSDGFMFRLRNGEWAWRPLLNPARLEISTFAEQTPLGFGLIQRERRFSAYEDLEARYERRPSIWVAPRGDWGRGKLMLVEIPTTNEYNDNIVAFWRPAEPWRPGEEVSLAYTMYWGLDTPTQPSVSRVAATRSGLAPSGARLFVIDFESENETLFDDAVAKVTASQGDVANVTLTRNRERGGVRLSFELSNTGAGSAELRAVLTRGEQAVSETWLYRWSGA